MFNITEKTIVWGDRELTLQTGKIARLADGAVVAKYGETEVLATVVFDKKPKYDLNFFPLTVHYQDKYYAAGKIPGGFFKREGKQTEREILISRLIDRPIRPLFDERFRNEVQIVVSVLNYDDENSVDVLSIIAASAALAISGIPMAETVGAAKVGYINNNFVLNPTKSQMPTTNLDLVVAGTAKGVLMVESEAKELDEAVMLDAVKFAHNEFSKVITLIEDLKQAVNKPMFEVEPFENPEVLAMVTELNAFAKDSLVDAFSTKDKAQRSAKIKEAMELTLNHLTTKEFSAELLDRHFGFYFKKLEKDIVRGDILNKAVRIDGRGLEDIRPIVAEIDLFKRAHGSALFTRGETQALVFATLGTDSDEQIIDDIEGDTRGNFMLHYNFPPFSVGEVGRMAGPGRREVGHGKLAWRAIKPVLPNKDDFPYTLRVVSEITESNGSSSMATVCGSSLALMSAGVPLGSSVAGIAMGLIKEDDKFAVLSDILGDEDHLGDMDFKVAGTANGITALQMDIKITSITYDIMQQALQQAKAGRNHILNIMLGVISKHKDTLSEYAPKVETLKIDKEKIKDVIGSGGKVIKEICATNNVKIDISEDGVVKIFGTNPEGLKNALKTVQGIVEVPEIGKEYVGKVVKVLEFGAFVNLLPKTDGFLHISELTKDRGVDINTLIKEGETVNVKLVSIDDKGRLKLAKIN